METTEIPEPPTWWGLDGKALVSRVESICDEFAGSPYASLGYDGEKFRRRIADAQQQLAELRMEPAFVADNQIDELRVLNEILDQCVRQNLN